MLIGRYTALLDACVLHPAFVRGALLWFADERLFRPLWSDDVRDEWHRSVANRFKDADLDKLKNQYDLMNAANPDALVLGHRDVARALTLPDPDDCHVLAAAIVGRADAIITANSKDFPPEVAQQYGIEIRHPDDFIVNIIDLQQTRALAAIRRHRAVLKNPPYTGEEFVEKFQRAGLIQSYQRLLPFADLI